MTYDIGKSLDGLGLPVVRVKVGAYLLGFVVDTGSTHCLLDQGVANQLCEQLAGHFVGQDQPFISFVEDADCSIMGIDGNPQQNKAVMLRFEFENQPYTQQFICQPLYNAFSSFEQKGIHIHGLLGNDFLTSAQWIINYQTNSITT